MNTPWELQENGTSISIRAADGAVFLHQPWSEETRALLVLVVQAVNALPAARAALTFLEARELDWHTTIPEARALAEVLNE